MKKPRIIDGLVLRSQWQLATLCCFGFEPLFAGERGPTLLLLQLQVNNRKGEFDPTTEITPKCSCPTFQGSVSSSEGLKLLLKWNSDDRQVSVSRWHRGYTGQDLRNSWKRQRLHYLSKIAPLLGTAVGVRCRRK